MGGSEYTYFGCTKMSSESDLNKGKSVLAVVKWKAEHIYLSKSQFYAPPAHISAPEAYNTKYDLNIYNEQTSFLSGEHSFKYMQWLQQAEEKCHGKTLFIKNWHFWSHLKVGLISGQTSTNSTEQHDTDQ